jgi:hypothetical protein
LSATVPRRPISFSQAAASRCTASGTRPMEAVFRYVSSSRTGNSSREPRARVRPRVVSWRPPSVETWA